MTDFPTVGLGVDLSGIQQGEAAYDSLQRKIQGVGDAAASAASRMQGSIAQQTQAVQSGQSQQTAAATQGAEARATAAERAAARQAAADQAAFRQAVANFQNLQQIQARSTQQTPWYVAQAQQFAAAQAQMVADARAAAAAVERAEAQQQAAMIEAATTVTAAQRKMWQQRLADTVQYQTQINQVIAGATAFAEEQAAQAAAAVAAQEAATLAAAQRSAALTAQDRGQVIGGSAPAQQAESVLAMEAALKAEARAQALVATATANTTEAVTANTTAQVANSAAVQQTMSYAERAAARLIAQNVTLEEARILFNNNAQAGAVLAAMERQLAEATAAETGATVANTAAHGAAAGAAAGSSQKMRELTVVVREFLRGDFSRMPGSLLLLGQLFGVVTAEMVSFALSFAAAIAPFALFAYAIAKGQEEINKLNGALLATGGYANLTAGQVDAMAHKIADASDTTIGETRKTIEALVESGRYTGDTIASLADAAQNYSRITGKNASDFVQSFEGMKDHLVQFAVKHEEVYHDLTLAQVDHIALLVKEGQETRAQAELAADIDTESKQRMKQQEADNQAHFGLLQRLMHETATAASDMWDSILNIGRPKTLDEQVTDAIAEVNRLKTATQNAQAGGPTNTPDLQSQNGLANGVQLNAAQGRLADLRYQQAVAATDRLAAAQRTQFEHDAIQKKYGDGKTHTPHSRTPTDETESYDARVQATNAQVDQQIAQAKLSYLNSLKSLVEGPDAQAALQAQIDQKQYDVQIAAYDKQIAGIDAQIATINKAKLDNHAKQQKADLEADKNRLQEVEAQAAATQAIKDMVARRNQLVATTAEQVAQANGALQLQEQGLQNQADLLKSSTARDDVEKHVLQLRLKELDNDQKLIDVKVQAQQAEQAKLDALQAQVSALPDDTAADQKIKAQKQAEIDARQKIIDQMVDPAAQAIAQQQLDKQRLQIDGQIKVIDSQTDLVHRIEEASSAMGDFAGALSSHNWAQAMDALMRTIQTVQASIASKGLTGGALTAAGAVGGMLSGHGGALGSIGNALSIGSGIGGIAAGLPGMAATLLPGLADSGALMSGLMGIASFAGPIAIVAGVAALAASLLGNHKPSNFTATAQFNGLTGASYGGDKPNDNTTQLINSVGQGVLQAENQLKALGVTLGATVSSIAIGQRDPSKITLSNGQTISAGAGDAAGATDAALKAVLKSATYVDSTEQKLVNSMLDAGKGFDDIATAIQNYQSAQTSISGIDDAILQLTDPLAYALKQVTDGIKGQLDAVGQAYQNGYISAGQYTAAVAKLSKLQDLELQKALADSSSNVTKAQQDLNSAYSTASDALKTVKQGWDGLVSSLTAFKQQLTTGSLAENSPQDQYNLTKANFESIAAKAKTGDQTAAGQLQAAGQDFLTASKAYFATTEPYYKDLAEVKSAVDASTSYAQQQSDIATQQLAALDQQVSGLTTVNASVLSVKDAIAALAAAQAAQAAAQAQATAAAQKAAADAAAAAAKSANDNSPASSTQDWNKLLAARPDVLAAYNAAAAQAAAGNKDAIASLREKNITSAQSYAQWWYSNGGSASFHFANGGAFDRGQIVDTPTNFAIGQMGEAGAEGVFPLTRTASGKLGVHVIQPASIDLKPLLGEVQALRKQMVGVAGMSAQQQINVLQELKGEMAAMRREMRQQRGVKTAKAA